MLDRTPMTIGSDPEAFLSQNGAIVGSEKILGLGGAIQYGSVKIVCDGVQVEFHFTAGEDPQDLCSYIQQGLLYFDQWSKSKDLKAELDWTECLDIPLEELLSLSEKSRELLCLPSLNYYDGQGIIEVPPLFQMRSAGGHLHLGLPPPIWNDQPGMYRDERRSLVPLLDWAVGSTLVLLNTGEAQRRRRTIYGRSGEFRLPQHGLEYRTPSNFWVRDPVLTQFVFGLAKFTVDVYYTSLRRKNGLDDQLMNGFDVPPCRTAIDHNDYGQALQNFESLVPFFEEHGRTEDPLNKETIPHFRKFLSVGINDALPLKGVLTRWGKFTGEMTWEKFIKRF